MPRTVGVLGGMGPLAGAVFTQYLVELTPVSTDQEHIPVLLINDPGIPDRTAYILGTSTRSPLPQLVQHARKLEQMGAELIAIPCNTVHVFWSEIARAVSIPVLNILDETVRRIESEEGSRRIGLLATKGTVKAGLYQQGLDDADCELVLPSDELQHRVQSIIKAVKGNQDRSVLRQMLREAVLEIQNTGADRVILGCTELSLIRPDNISAQLLDSMKILAEATVEQAFRDRH